jgi:hypothetical protein
MLEESGFVDVMIGPPTDTFGGAGGERNARRRADPHWSRAGEQRHTDACVTAALDCPKSMQRRGGRMLY